MNITGHHHISIYTKNAQENKSFYTDVLGLRLVEKSVNQDNPGMYHLFYGDETGTPGTLVTFFEIPTIGKNRPGTDAVNQISLLVPDQEALDYFQDRLEKENIPVYKTHYLNQNAVSFQDPDGLSILLISNADYHTPAAWRKSPYSNVPENYQIMGLGPVEITVRDQAPTVTFLQDILGYHLRDSEETIFTLDNDSLYSDLVIIENQNETARPGRGYVHHIALNTPSDDDLNEVRRRINHEFGEHLKVIDRYFFKSLYFRHNKIMFEFATELPGFTVDTPVQDLGKALNLPDFLEHKRVEIESRLHKI